MTARDVIAIGVLAAGSAAAVVTLATFIAGIGR